MPVDSLSSLRSMSLAQGSFVRLDQASGQLTTTGTRAHFWQRAQAAQEKAGNRAAAERVRDSICAHCGKAEGTRLFNHYIGSKALSGRAFTSASLARLLDAASERGIAWLARRGVEAVGSRALRPDVRTALERAAIPPEDFTALVMRSVRLLESDLFGPRAFAEGTEELATVSRELDRLHATLDTLRTSLPAPLPEVDGLCRYVDGLRAQLTDKAALLLAQKDQNPFTGKNVRTAFRQVYEAYEQVIMRHLERIGHELGHLAPDAPQALRLAGQARALSHLLRDVQTDRVDPPEVRNVADDALVPRERVRPFLELPARLGKALHEALPTLSAGAAAKEVKEAHLHILNTQGWDIIQRDMQYLGQAGRAVTATSTITPARHLGQIGASMARHGLNGISCEDRGQPRHALNLAATEVSTGGTVLFRGIRHGINSAYSIKDPAARQAANATRAREIFAAALHSSPALLQAARAAAPGDVIDLPLLSTSLVTPDVPRDTFGTSERTYLAEQCASWKDACAADGTCRVEVAMPDGGSRTVTVRPTVLTFNFGVNTGAQSASLQGLFGGWGTSGRYNTAAMDQLFGPKEQKRQGGLVRAFLDRPGLSAADRQVVADLRDQILALWEGKGYRTDGEDPYRLPARLALLAHHMGMMPLFNCKSGKDRTGQMDVACKTLALQMHENNGRPPAPDRPRSGMDRQIFHQVAINGGNLEMQRLNTGLAGFKTKGVAGLDALFSAEALAMHRGLSSYVKA